MFRLLIVVLLHATDVIVVQNCLYLNSIPPPPSSVRVSVLTAAAATIDTHAETVSSL